MKVVYGLIWYFSNLRPVHSKSEKIYPFLAHQVRLTMQSRKIKINLEMREI